MTNALAVREPTGALAIQADQVRWEPMQLAALGQLGIADAPDGDKQVFLHVSQRTGLDPFARQIYMIGRPEKKNRKLPNGQWTEEKTTKWTIQTGIEGWRVIRDRAERRNGVRGIKSRFTYYAPDGSDHKVWVRRDPPVACEMTYTVIEPGGREVPYTSVLRFNEYVQTKTVKQDGQDVTVAVAQWATKPVHMLEKCVEADAYRCAFPQDYSGVVLDDAMPYAEPDEAPAAPERQRVTGEQARARAAQYQQPQPVGTASGWHEQQNEPADAEPVDAVIVDSASDEQRAEIKAHLDRLRIPNVQRAALITDIAGRDVDAADLTQAEATRIIGALEDRETPAPDPTTSGASSSADDPAPSSPTGTGQQSPSSPSGSETTTGDPHNDVLFHLSRLHVTGTPAISSMLSRLTGRQIASAESLNRKQAEWFARELATITTPDELEAAAVAAEARRDEGTATDGQ